MRCRTCRSRRPWTRTTATRTPWWPAWRRCGGCSARTDHGSEPTQRGGPETGRGTMRRLGIAIMAGVAALLVLGWYYRPTTSAEWAAWVQTLGLLAAVLWG